jgi:hypothetical protein
MAYCARGGNAVELPAAGRPGIGAGMSSNRTKRMQDAVANMAFGCAGAQPGARILILHEPAAEDHYEAGLCEDVHAAAEALGLVVECREIAFSPEPADPPPHVLDAMEAADHILYLARLGDQMRFRPLPHARKSIVSYAVTRAAMAGPFGTAPHKAMLELKEAVNAALRAAREIRVTCPLGSDFAGHIAPATEPMADVGILRFPMAVFAPVPMEGFAGQAALARFLVGTGSLYYEPFVHRIDGTATVRFVGTRITGYDGPAETVAGIRAHVAALAARYGLDADFVHSWHAGIHPGCAYEGAMADNPGRWTGSAFGNPRLLHVHTCGSYAPGEVCWNLLDPTITLDGVALWQQGRLHPDRIPGGPEILDTWPDLRALFAAHDRAVGID